MNGRSAIVNQRILAGTNWPLCLWRQASVRIGGPANLIKQPIQPVVEQIRIAVKGHRRRRMPEHPLHRLHIAAGVDRDRRGGLPRVVAAPSS